MAPCQGWELGLRVDYPLTGGVVSWAATKDISNVQIRYTTNPDPQSQDDFQTAIANVTGGFTGQQCIDGPNFSALGLNAGDQVTMQLTYQTGPNKWDMYEVGAARWRADRADDSARISTSSPPRHSRPATGTRSARTESRARRPSVSARPTLTSTSCSRRRRRPRQPRAARATVA